MPTAEKRAVLDEISDRLKESNAIYIANYSGMSVAQANKLRGAFRKGNVFYKVYKNKLMKLAMQEVGGYDAILDSLTEQNGFAFVEEELSAPAKVLKDFMVYVYGMRSDAIPIAPMGWRLEDDDHLEGFKKVMEKSASILDSL